MIWTLLPSARTSSEVRTVGKALFRALVKLR